MNRIECNEEIKCDNILYSAKYMLSNILKEIYDEQIETFGVKGMRNKMYIYLNNYCLSVDTVFRLLLKIRKVIRNTIKQYNAKRLYLVCDITMNDIHKLNYTKKNIQRNLVIIYAIRSLRSLSNFLDDDETENFDAWERLLSKECAAEYNFSIHHPSKRINNYYRHEQYSKKFMMYISYLQIGLQDEMLYDIIMYVFRIIKLNNINGLHMVWCNNRVNLYNLISMLSNFQTLVILNERITIKNVYYLFHDKIYYNQNGKTKYQGEVKTVSIKQALNGTCKHLLDLYDRCEQYNNGIILEINSAYGINIYQNMSKVLLSNELYGIRQECILPDEEYAWLCKEQYASTIQNWIESFNRLSKIKIIEK